MSENRKEKTRKYNQEYYRIHKIAINASNKRYHQENKESILQTKRSYRIKNKDAVNATKRRYYRGHTEAKLTACKKYREKNIENERARGRQYYYINRETVNNTSKIYRSKNLCKVLLARAKKRSAIKKLEFNITMEHLLSIWPKDNRCPILGTIFEVDSDKRHTGASLDRIDNTKGYVVGNVQVISTLANSMKATADTDQLKKFAHYYCDKPDLQDPDPIGNYIETHYQDSEALI